MGLSGHAPVASPADPRSRWLAIQAFLQRDATGEAVAQARAFTGAYPDHAPAFAAASQAELAVGNPRGAYTAARRVIELAPQWWAGFARLGEAAFELDELRTARVAATRAVELDPTCAEAHTLLGRIAAARGKVRAARRALAEALRIQPDYPEVRDLLAALTAVAGSGHRRKAYEYVVDRVARGDRGVEFLATIVDDAVRRRARWLALGVSYWSLIYFAVVFATGPDKGYGASTVAVPLVCSAAVLAMYLWWVVPLVWAMPPAARRLLPGLHRRERLEAFALWGYSIPVLVMLTIPLWWIAGAAMPVMVASAVAAGLPIVTEVLVAGIGFGLSVVGARELLLGLVTRPYTIPAVLAVALVTALIRTIIRAARPRRDAAPCEAGTRRRAVRTRRRTGTATRAERAGPCRRG